MNNLYKDKNNNVFNVEYSEAELKLHNTNRNINNTSVQVQRRFSNKRRGSLNEAGMTECALLINGRSLSTVFSNHELSTKIVGLFKRAESVIVYRSSPDEKA